MFGRRGRTGCAVALIAVLLLLRPGLEVPRASATPPNGCPAGNTWVRGNFTSNASIDGAQAGVTIQQMVAPDWDANGFAASTVWLTTDNTDENSAQPYWVEVGVSKGWEGTNVYTYYSAHWAPGGSYIQKPFDMAVYINHIVTFKIIRTSSGQMKPSVTDDSNNNQQVSRLYNGHSSPFPTWSIGAEYTCRGASGSQIDKMYVYENEARLISNDSWEYPDTGSLERRVSETGQGIDWCYQNINFKYWVRSSTSTSSCQ